MGRLPNRALVVVAVAVALVTAGCDWAQPGNGANNARASSDPAISIANVGALQGSWVGTMPSSSAPPVVSSGFAYAGASDGSLYVFDATAASCSGTPTTCAPVWTGAGSGAITTSAAVVNGVVLVTAGTKLDAFDANGATGCSGSPVVCTPLWTAHLGSNASAPVAEDGVVAVTGGGSVMAFDAAGVNNCSGSPKVCKPLWSATTNGSQAPAIQNHVVYAPGDRLYAFDATGVNGCAGNPVVCAPLWTSPPLPNGATAPAVTDGKVFVRSDRVYAFDAAGVTGCSGAPKTCAAEWQSTTGSGGSIAVASGLVYSGGAAFDEAGSAGCSGSPVTCSPRFTFSGGVSSAPIVVNGVVYGASGNSLSAYDATGVAGCSGSPATCAPAWTTNLVFGPSSPIVAQGTLYVASTLGNLYAYAPWTFQRPACPDNPNPGLSPCQLQDAYRLPSGVAGAKKTIAIVDAFDSPNAEADLAVYRDTYGLPPCTTGNGCFHKYAQNGSSTYPQPNAGWSIETSLDLDMVSATCPLCNITLVEGDSDSVGSLGLAESQAATYSPAAISNSYGIGEGSPELSYDHYYTHPGIAITVATGDSGWGTSWPAVSPNVVSVGGTNLATDSSTPRGWSETAWSGAGSGCSAYEPLPSWASLSRGCANRSVADVSAMAGNPGVSVYDTYQLSGWLLVGGTSAAAPIVAGAYGLAPTVGAVGDLNAHPGALFDVTSGSNGSCNVNLCNAGVGWDGPTGNGTPCGVGSLAIVGFGADDCAAAVTPLAGVHANGGPKPPAVTYTPACDTPKPGHVRCFALKMTRA